MSGVIVMVVFLPKAEEAALLDLIEQKMKEANRSLGDKGNDTKEEAKKVLQRVLQSSESKNDLSDKLVKVCRNLESVTPASKVAWFLARSSLVKRMLETGSFQGEPGLAKAAETLLKEKNPSRLEGKAGDIAKIQSFLKASRSRDSALLMQCSAVLNDVMRLPADSPQQIQLLSQLVTQLQNVPIDKHLRDTIVSASAQSDTTNSVQVLIKLISVALASQYTLSKDTGADSVFEDSILCTALAQNLQQNVQLQSIGQQTVTVLEPGA